MPWVGDNEPACLLESQYQLCTGTFYEKIWMSFVICHLLWVQCRWVSIVSKKSIYIVHRRETSIVLNASVRCKQKRFYKLFKTVPANNRILQAVRQGIRDRRTSHTASPSAIGAELVARYDQELSGGGSEMLPWCDTCSWLAQFHEVRRRLTVKAVEYHDVEFVQD